MTRATKTFALANGACEADIPKTTLKIGEIIRLSHDARGFFYGQIREASTAGATGPKRKAEQTSKRVTLESVSPSRQAQTVPPPPVLVWTNSSFPTAYKLQQESSSTRPQTSATGSGSVQAYPKRVGCSARARRIRGMSPFPTDDPVITKPRL